MIKKIKNPAAVALGKLRWAGISQAERSRQMRILGYQRAKTRRAKHLNKPEEIKFKLSE